MMVFSACVNDTVRLQYVFLLKKNSLGWALVHHVTFSSPPAIWCLSVYFKRYKTHIVLP